MDTGVSFGIWLKRRRKSLDLTQSLLAQRVFCSLATIQKIESEERRPSHQLAELLAIALEIPAQDRPLFLQVARGERGIERLANISDPAEWPLLSTRQNNLPIPPTPLIGRERELADLIRLIAQPDCRLLTLIGPGGVGKTRLAIAVAADRSDAFTHGVCFVPLAPLTKPEFIVPAIASALNYTPSGPAEPQTQLLNYLHVKEVLLVLDDLEHLLSDIRILTDMLKSAPRVKILATSRERLNLQGEWIFDLHSLPTPNLGTPAEIEENSAVQLFVCAAQRLHFDFSVTEQNRQAVVRICQLVEGIPLALELAAAWTRSLSCQEIVDEIEASLDFLSVTGRDQPERHHSLRAVFDHSWRLLNHEGQRALRQLSVFQGGFRREGAEKVAGASLSTLSALTEKSLLHRTEAGRYDMHELIRQYSAFKLIEADEEAAISQIHFDYYGSFVENAEPFLTTAEWGVWFDRLEAEYDNLRTALGWGLAKIERSEPILQLAGGLYWFWYHRGDLSEGRTWLEDALRRADDSVSELTRARALFGAGGLAYLQGDSVFARSSLEQSVALWRACGTPGRHGLAHGLIALGRLARDQGNLTMARALSEESVALFEEQGDQWGLAYALNYLGMVLRDETDYTQARSRIETSVVMWRELGDVWGLANSLHSLGLVALRMGDYEAARSRCEEALILRQRSGYRQGVAYSLHTLGAIALNQGDTEAAKPYFQQCRTLFNEIGDKYGRASTFQYEGYLALLEGDDIQAQSLIEQGLTLARAVGPKWFSAYCLARLAGVAAVRGQPIQAVVLWEAANVLMAASASYMDSADRIYYERTIAPACVALDEASLEAARTEGSKMSLDQAIALALRVVHAQE